MWMGGSKSCRQWRGPKNKHMKIFVTFLVLIIISVLLFAIEKKENSSLTLVLDDSSRVGSPLTTYIENGTDVIWKIPDSPKEVLFLAHGCHGRAVNFWSNSPECPKCIGLPEEKQIVLHALNRKFAVLTISSAGRCWSFGEERLIIKGIIERWIIKNKLKKLPLVALGASSGGYFISALATDLRFSSIVLIIAAGMFDQMNIPENYPPTLFVHMTKDKYRKQKIYENVKLLQNKGIDVADVKCVEYPLTPTYFAERITDLDKDVSVKLYELFRNKGFIDSDGYMKKDGRSTPWRQALMKSGMIFSNKHLLNHIEEELNLAYAYHEMTSLQSEQIFKWFESHMN